MQSMTIGEILKMAGLLRQFQDENDLEERISYTTGTDPADIDIKATDADRKAADKNIIIQLRRAQDMSGKADVTFLDNPRKKEKIDIRIINKALDMFDKMRPNDKAKMQSIISKSYKGLLDVVKRGRV